MTLSRTCILHIGTPKAGSTTIQGFLQQHRAELAARGVDVPLFPENDVVRGGKALAGALRRETDPAAPVTPSWRWLDRHLGETSGDLCISRESLCMRLGDEARLAFLRGFFARRGVRLKILAYVRDSVSFVNANFSQNAKKLRLGVGFDAWAEAMLADPPQRFVYWHMFRHMIGDDEVEFVLQPLAALGPTGLLPHVLAHLGCGDLDPAGFDDAPYRNATPGPKVVAAGLAIGRILADRGIDARANPTLARDFMAMAAERQWAEKPFYGPDEATARRIADRFADGNERLARAVWGTGWPAHAHVRPTSRNQFDRTTASPADRADVDALVADFVARFLDRSVWSRFVRWRAPVRSAGARPTATAPSAPRG